VHSNSAREREGGSSVYKHKIRDRQKEDAKETEDENQTEREVDKSDSAEQSAAK